MKKNILVTGCNGFVGRHLTASLIKDGNTVFGVDLQQQPIDDRLHYSSIDLSDIDGTIDLVKNGCFLEIYHLAAVANPRQAKESPATALKTSSLSTIGLLEGCRVSPTPTKVLFVGSSEEYKKKKEDSIQFSERDELDARTIYGTSKVISEQIVKSYVNQYGVTAFFTRSFNHTGPGQSPAYVLSDFAKQIAEIKLSGQAGSISTGTIDIERDFLDVRDVIVAYRKIVEFGKTGETYNVCSGNPVSLRYCIQKMLDFAGLTNVKIVQDENRIRGKESFQITGNNNLLVKDTGWSREIAIETTLKDLLTYWLTALRIKD